MRPLTRLLFQSIWGNTGPSAIAASFNLADTQSLVNGLIEMMDMREAQRSYQANLNVIDAAKSMITRALDLLRG